MSEYPAESIKDFYGLGESLLLDLRDIESLTADEILALFVKSEIHYFQRVLRPINLLYIQRIKTLAKMRSSILSDKEARIIFGNMEVLFKLHEQMSELLLDLSLRNILLERIGPTMRKMIPMLKLYHVWAGNFSESCQTIKSKEKSSTNFREFLNINEQILGTQLQVLLASPIARLPQYLCFLGAVHKNLLFYSKEAIAIEEAIIEIKESMDKISKELRMESKKNNVIAVQAIFKDTPLITPSRYMVKSGYLKMFFKKKFGKLNKMRRFYFVLFNDLLLYGVTSGKGTSRKGKVKSSLSIERLSVEMLDGFSFRISTDSESFVVIAESSVDRTDWMSTIENVTRSFNDKKMNIGSIGNALPIRKYSRRITKRRATRLQKTSNPNQAFENGLGEIPESPSCPESCWTPNPPDCPLRCDVPPCPTCPVHCWIPECPSAPKEIFHANSVGERAALRTRMLKSTMSDASLALEKVDDIFSTIRRGVTLRPISPDEKRRMELKRAASGSQLSLISNDSLTPETGALDLDMQTSLHISLMRYRQFVTSNVDLQEVEEQEDDLEDDEDWE